MKKFDLNDILIQPNVTTKIRHRDEINPFDKNGFLPLITAPMDTVIGANNSLEFSKRKINVCLPRNEEGKPFEFESFGMEDFEDLVKKRLLEPNGYYLIDIANGHMKDLIHLVKLTKKIYKDLTLMVGNIANPETYVELSNVGADFIRCGIGNGCFIDGMLVTTKKGKVKIEDVGLNDEVLTKNGEFKKVIGKKRIEHNGDIIRINNDISCTPDHHFYVLNKKYLNQVNDENIHDLCEWVSAMELYETSDYLLIEYNN